MAKHAKETGVAPAYTRDLSPTNVIKNGEDLANSVKVIDDSIAKHPIPPPTVKE
jgi:hypothetical protein